MHDVSTQRAAAVPRMQIDGGFVEALTTSPKKKKNKH
jgi:hypothetical protein